jgi:Fur family transcriptional regulator, ferric uptake regulator
MSCLAGHSKTLRERGYRMTAQRLAILEALHYDGHLSPAQIYAHVRQTGMTEATVYRTLEFLTENGIIASAQNPGGHLTYELTGHNHHHLVCRNCGKQVQIEHEALQGLISQLEQQTGYCLNTGHLTLFGLCPTCQKQSE